MNSLATDLENGKSDRWSRLRCLQLSDGKAVMVGRKISFPQAVLARNSSGKIMGFMFAPFSSPASIGLRAFGAPSANADCAAELLAHHQGWARPSRRRQTRVSNRAASSGMGVTKAPIPLCKGNAAYIEPQSARKKHRAYRSWRKRLARGLTAFFLASPCSPSAAAHPYAGSR